MSNQPNLPASLPLLETAINLPPSIASQYPKYSYASPYPALKNVSFSFCNLSAAAELALDPKWALVVSTKTACSVNVKTDSHPSAPVEGSVGYPIGSLSLEGRRYFDMDGADRRGFISGRVGTSKNLGMALGLSFSNKHREHGGLSVHVGGYLNLAKPWEIKPTLGMSFAWSSF